MNRSTRILLVVAASLAGVGVLLSVHLLARRLAAPVVEGGLDNALAQMGRAPMFALTSESGKTVTNAELAGRVWIADFVFVNCSGSCPILTSRMSALARKLAHERKIAFVSFDVDPDRDSLEDLAKYAKGFGADPRRWSFLRGEKGVIRSISRDGFKLGIQDGNASDPEPILHSSRFVLVDGAGTIRGYYDGTSPGETARLADDARKLVAELGAGR